MSPRASPTSVPAILSVILTILCFLSHVIAQDPTSLSPQLGPTAVNYGIYQPSARTITRVPYYGPLYTLPFLWAYLNPGARYQVTTTSTSTSTYTLICTTFVRYNCTAPFTPSLTRRRRGIPLEEMMEDKEASNDSDEFLLTPSSVRNIEPTPAVDYDDQHRGSRMMDDSFFRNSPFYIHTGPFLPYEVQSTFIDGYDHQPGILTNAVITPRIASDLYGTRTITASTFTVLVIKSSPSCFKPGPYPICPK